MCFVTFMLHRFDLPQQEEMKESNWREVVTLAPCLYLTDMSEVMSDILYAAQYPPLFYFKDDFLLLSVMVTIIFHIKGISRISGLEKKLAQCFHLFHKCMCFKLNIEEVI